MLALETRLRKFKGEARMRRDELVSAKQASVLLPKTSTVIVITTITISSNNQFIRRESNGQNYHDRQMQVGELARMNSSMVNKKEK